MHIALRKACHKIAQLFVINFNNNRIYGLDILRALAISFVVFGHATVFLPQTGLINKFFEWAIFDGVSIFFVLSGYLIGTILLKNISNNVATFKTLLNFWQRRWFRTLPNYFLILTIIIILAWCGQIYIMPPHVEKYYLFLQNINSANPNFFNEAWSLSVEEWFYLLIPLIIIILNSTLRITVKRSFIYSAFLIIVLVTFLRFYRFSHFPDKSIYGWGNYFRKEVSTRFDSIMYGMLGAFLAFYYKQLFIKYTKPCFAIGLFLLLFDKLYTLYNPDLYTSIYQYVFSFSVISIGTLLLIPFLSEIKNGRGFLYKAVTYISLTSYSMYLINYSLILKFLIPLLLVQLNTILQPPISTCIGYFLFLIFTTAFSILLYKFFEKPVTDLRNNYKTVPK
jgi:peptidoglycan/LPS O-acetylase OafA/YrhL